MFHPFSWQECFAVAEVRAGSLMRRVISVSAIIMMHPIMQAQSSKPLEYEVVSIKRSASGAIGGGMRTMPDGTFMMTNQPIRSVILSASPAPAREVIGIPDWVNTERYDLTAKPPENSTREQRREMWQTLFADRMKLVAHVEERERDTFALVLARSDGRLGPQLKLSTLDCSPRPAGTPPPPPPTAASIADMANRCGMAMGNGTIVSGSTTLDQFVASLGGLAGGLVNNRTGRQGSYALTLKYSSPRLSTQNDAAADDAPDIFTALQEQLGLKLRREKTMVPVFVVDHIERPSDN